MTETKAQRLIREGRAYVAPNGNVWSRYQPPRCGDYYEAVLAPLARQREQEAQVHAEVRAIVDEALDLQRGEGGD